MVFMQEPWKSQHIAVTNEIYVARVMSSEILCICYYLLHYQSLVLVLIVILFFTDITLYH